MTEKEYLMAVSAFGYFGPKRLRLLVNYFKTAENLWNCQNSDFQEIGLSQIKISEFDLFRKSFDIPKYLGKIKKYDVKIYSIKDPEYPANLKDVEDAPLIIYVRGDLKKIDENSVAIVGTRMMTSYGREVTQKIAGELASYGVTVVSGLALGVDACAQKAAIEAGGRTLAVLASGLDIISPFSNKLLGEEIIKGNGAIISEKPLGHTPFKQDFAVRNRLISGLSRAVVVVEGRMKSGTFYTVDAAADQGRSVFAVPGPITSPASEGPNYLIQNGAKVVFSAKDVVDELDLELKVNAAKIDKVLPADPDEGKIYKILDAEPMHLDELGRILGLPPSAVSARLTFMEIRGLVKNLGKGIYKKI